MVEVERYDEVRMMIRAGEPAVSNRIRASDASREADSDPVS